MFTLIMSPVVTVCYGAYRIEPQIIKHFQNFGIHRLRITIYNLSNMYLIKIKRIKFSSIKTFLNRDAREAARVPLFMEIEPCNI